MSNTILALTLALRLHSTADLPLTPSALTGFRFVACADAGARDAVCNSEFAPLVRFYADGLATSEILSLNGCWQIRDRDTLLINGHVFRRNRDAGSFFSSSESQDARFGTHLLLRSDATRWSRHTERRFQSPHVHRALLRGLMAERHGLHDICIELAGEASYDDVVYLLLALPRRSEWQRLPPERRGYSCTVSHCLDALRMATGLDYGVVADDWYEALRIEPPPESTATGEE